MLEGRGILTNRLQRQLAHLASYLDLAGQNNLSSSHVEAETTAEGLLNRVYGWELRNANVIRQNFPGVDLIDEARNIAVQVTATRTAEKVRHTLEEAGKGKVTYSKLIVLVLTNQPVTAGMKSCTVPTYHGAMEVWNLADVYRVAGELDTARLSELTEYMEAELGSIKERVKELRHLELPAASALPPTGFVGREAELAEIRSRFEKGDKQVVLTGLGGMGKTELAARYGSLHPGMVYFVRFDTNFTRTISNMVHGIRPKLGELELKVDEVILRKKVLDLLEQTRPEDLLIIDNADSATGNLADLLKDKDFKTISDLPMKLLLTTRSDAPRAIEVRPMPEEPLFEIFRNHGAELSKQEMKDLIDAVNGHTLTIDLIARTLNGKGWRKVTAEKMLTALRDRTLPSQKYRRIATDYNQSTEQAQIYEHLSVVFDMSGMSELGKKVMRCASLLPEGGMDSELFGTSLDEDEQDALDSLLERGWLEVRKGLLVIHPVIRLVCLEELKPTDTDCKAFLDRLWEQFDVTKYLPDQYAQMAELFTEAHDRFGKHHGRWLNRSGIILNEIGQYQTLYDMYHSRLPELEQALMADSKELATAYNYYGIALGKLGRYPASLTYYEKALAIRKEVLPENDPDLARSYNNIGAAHGDLGDYRNELEYKRKAMAIFEEVLPAGHPDLATSYTHVGSAYDNLGDHKRALKFHLKALAIREKVLPADHPDLALSYSHVGGAYGNLGGYKQELEFHLKALSIREKVLPAGHPDLANSYNNVGATYADLEDHKRALEYSLKALVILEKVLPTNHPNLATSCNNIAWTYHDLGNLPEAARYMRRAADIISQSTLPKTHPDRINFPKWADQFEREADMEKKIKATMQGFGSTPPAFPFGKK